MRLDHVISCLEQGCLEHAGQFAHVSRPGVLQQGPQSRRTERNVAVLRDLGLIGPNINARSLLDLTIAGG